MKAGLLERIKTFGHWRVNIRPYTELAEPLSFARAFEVVDQSKVSIRGWDFPHVSRRNDESGALERGDGFVESWCDWSGQVEFWRMYRSGQFITYKALHYEVPNDWFHVKGRVLMVQDAIYAITEFCEFAFRLVSSGVHRDGSTMSVDLNGTDNRPLAAGPGRVPFFDARETQAGSVKMRRTITATEWNAGAAEISRRFILELFDHFGWNPPPEQIATEQESFYRRDFR